MTGKKTILIAAVALLAAGAIVWVVRGRQSRPNVLLITLDTTRADRLGCYGRASAMTPTLDGLAKSGTRFTRAFCNVPLTLPSHSTILTGLYPPEHGSRLNASWRSVRTPYPRGVARRPGLPDGRVRRRRGARRAGSG